MEQAVSQGNMKTAHPIFIFFTAAAKESVGRELERRQIKSSVIIVSKRNEQALFDAIADILGKQRVFRPFRA